MKRLNVFGAAALMVGLFGFLSGPAIAATDCTFTNKGATMSLDADCTTDATILVLDGWTLDGRGYSITAVDPDGGHFTGAVVMNEGFTAHVTNLVVQASDLINVCDDGADRLRGIMFDGASGSITRNTVQSINQGLSGCQEGNAIEVQNGYPGIVTVEITHNDVENYQKGGIICNGDVGVILWGEDGILDNNQIYDDGPDGNVNGWDVGVWAVTTTNVVTKNKIRGFDVPTIGVDEGNLAFIDGGQVMLQPVCFSTRPDCGVVAQ
jgi:hypothetical protein